MRLTWEFEACHESFYAKEIVKACKDSEGKVSSEICSHLRAFALRKLTGVWDFKGSRMKFFGQLSQIEIKLFQMVSHEMCSSNCEDFRQIDVYCLKNSIDSSTSKCVAKSPSSEWYFPSPPSLSCCAHDHWLSPSSPKMSLRKVYQLSLYMVYSMVWWWNDCKLRRRSWGCLLVSLFQPGPKALAVVSSFHSPWSFHVLSTYSKDGMNCNYQWLLCFCMFLCFFVFFGFCGFWLLRFLAFVAPMAFMAFAICVCGFCGFLALGFCGRSFKHQRQQSQKQSQQQSKQHSQQQSQQQQQHRQQDKANKNKARTGQVSIQHHPTKRPKTLWCDLKKELTRTS